MKLSANQQKAVAKFRNFISFRNKISLILSLIILVCYYVFVLGVGLFPEVLGYRLGPSSITLGIILGISLIVICIIATGLYTFLANTYFDRDQNEVLGQLEENDVLEALKSGEIHYREYELKEEGK